MRLLSLLFKHKFNSINGKSSLPFNNLVMLLKSEGFLIDLKDYVEFSAIFERFSDQKHTKLKYYLAPIICRSYEEQIKFYQLYDSCFTAYPSSNIIHKTRFKSKIGIAKFLSYLFLTIILVFSLILIYKNWLYSPREVTTSTNADTFLEDSAAEKERRNQKFEITVQTYGRPVLMGDPNTYYWGSIVFLVSIITLTVFFLNCIRKANKTLLLQNKSNIHDYATNSGEFNQLNIHDIPNFEGVEEPMEVPYLPKEQLIIKERSISQIAFKLQQQIEAEIPFLNIKKTILKSSLNFGFIEPIYSNRRRTHEFLVIIDGNDKYCQQTHLFQYLMDVFIKENVAIDYYLFYQDLEVYYKKGERIGCKLNDLKERHYNSILIIIGNGYSFLHPSLPIVKPNLQSEFSKWSKRLLVTPIPFLSWGNNELNLSTFFNLIPADLQGWINLLQFVNEDKDGFSSFTIKDWKTYTTKYLNFEDIDLLKAYLDDDDLFQWICGISVHHKIRFEILIEIGKQIFDANKVQYKLNYTNLLKIARIKWVEEGVFPTNLRLSLLKELTEQNELISRQVMLRLSRESDDVINENSFSFEEKQKQKYLDSFIVYANDPTRNLHLKAEALKFITLWENKQINDTALYNYLENNNLSWITPIKSLNNKDQSIGIDDFIKELNSDDILRKFKFREEWKGSELYYIYIFISWFVFLIGIGAFLHIELKNKIIQFWPINKLVENRRNTTFLLTKDDDLYSFAKDSIISIKLIIGDETYESNLKLNRHDQSYSDMKEGVIKNGIKTLGGVQVNFGLKTDYKLILNNGSDIISTSNKLQSIYSKLLISVKSLSTEQINSADSVTTTSADSPNTVKAKPRAIKAKPRAIKAKPTTSQSKEVYKVPNKEVYNVPNKEVYEVPNKEVNETPNKSTIIYHNIMYTAENYYTPAIDDIIIHVVKFNKIRESAEVSIYYKNNIIENFIIEIGDTKGVFINRLYVVNFKLLGIKNLMKKAKKMGVYNLKPEAHYELKIEKLPNSGDKNR